MKTNKIILIVIGLILNLSAFSQSIGVANIKSFNLYATSDVTATIARLELIKLNQYQVLDRFDLEEIQDAEKYDDCFGKTCLIEYGKLLNVDYLSVSYTHLTLPTNREV